ncbi:ATP-dependent helicase [Castellaniella sp. FW104-16D08]|uniref:ATP-dependent helicase n=1 Tax=unclassified Castellaniella TaxID=2617606 RepID=UPI0033150F16
MSIEIFRPTEQQARVIAYEGSAFISACPGAGKTRVLVERARRLLADRVKGKGVAFLSFTTAAISELETRLQREGLIEAPSFPHFIGTFDAFLWQYLIAPFGGTPGCSVRPRLIPDKKDWLVQPFAGAQALPLSCFDRATGDSIERSVARLGFKGQIAAYETIARTVRARFLKRGELDFDDAREISLVRLRDQTSSAILSRALAARFRELVVDEAQDCNPLDLEIIAWLRDAGIPVKVICDPNQAIYGFRGSVTDELADFAQGFQESARLALTGNFRSSAHISRAVAAFRVRGVSGGIDDAIGEYKDETVAVQVLSYSGKSVPNVVGARFRELTTSMGFDARQCPVLAATRRTGANALGYPADSGVRNLSYRLAMAVSNYHFSFELGGRKEALENLHKILLELEGRAVGKTYHQYIAELGLTPGAWRPHVLQVAEALRFDPVRFATADAWLAYARQLLAPCLPADSEQTISQRLRRNEDLANALINAPRTGHAAHTIHSVKGMEFPAVCVVLSPATAKSIMDSLVDQMGAADNEEVRKIYVGVSRAQRLLVIATPKSQARRLVSLLQSTGAEVSVENL